MTETVSGKSQSASVVSEDAFIEEWRDAEKRGYTHLILITANRLRMGKTYAAIRIGELLDPDFSIDNIGFETRWYIQQADKSKRGAILVLDEPNRAAGNRSWYTEENRGFSEYLQTNAYRGIHGLFPLPHAHLIDNSIAGVCTSQIVMDEPGHGALYLFERDQLNRSYSTYTPNWGQVYFSKPEAKLYHAYEKKRDEYTRERNRLFLAKLDTAMELEKTPTAKDMVNTILENKWTTAGQIQEGLGINRTRAYDLMRRARHEAVLRKIVYISQ